MTIVLHPGSVPLKQLETIYWTGEAAKLDASFDAGIQKAAARIADSCFDVADRALAKACGGGECCLRPIFVGLSRVVQAFSNVFHGNHHCDNPFVFA